MDIPILHFHTTVLCVNFRNDLTTTKIGILNERVFVIVLFEMSIWRLDSNSPQHLAWWCCRYARQHYNDVIMGAMASQITSLTIVYSSVYSGSDQRKHQSSTSQAFVRGIHQWPVNSPHKGPVTRKMFPFDDVIMTFQGSLTILICNFTLFAFDENALHWIYSDIKITPFLVGKTLQYSNIAPYLSKYPPAVAGYQVSAGANNSA